MNRDKQIEEMAWLKCRCHSNKGICGMDCKPCDLDCGSYHEAEALYNAGYRKSQDVAEKIFAEIGELINEYLDGRSYRHEFLTKIAELKKKYIGKDTNVTTNTEEVK